MNATITQRRSAHARALTGLILVLLALGAGPLVAQPGATIRSGHAGHWYDPARNGEGWVLELLGDDHALLYWFTYDEAGRQRWLTAVGQRAHDDNGDYLDFPALFVTRGGRFGPDFDPTMVVREEVGSARLRFADCDHGQLSYQAFEQAQTFSIVRLTHTMGTLCESRHGVPGRDSATHAGQSGSWYDPSHNGEGYSLQWLDSQRALITWYSYDSEGRQYWMLGVGTLDDAGQLHFPDLHATRGARFGAAFDPDDVERFDWGVLTLDLNCATGSADYASELAPFGSGHFDLVKLTDLRGLACPWQRPTLTDVYEISYTEIPIEPGPPSAPNQIQVRGIADDGTVAGVLPREIGYDVIIRAPDATEWVLLPPTGPRGLFDNVFTSPDGSIIGTQLRSDPAVADSKPVIWRGGSWSLIENVLFSNSIVDGASPDRGRLVGRGRNSDNEGDTPWIWDEANGQVALTISEEIPGGNPRAASNDGRIVIGTALRQVGGVPRRRAIRWVDNSPPELLFDASGAELAWPLYCNADCSIVFGVDQSIPDPDHPHAGQPWYWKAPGVMGYLGSGDGAVLGYYAPYWLADGTDDGSLVVGSYAIDEFANSDGYVWTQLTGLVPVAALLHEFGLESSWGSRSAISVTSSGDRILLFGHSAPEVHTKAAVLRLQPKTTDW